MRGFGEGFGRVLGAVWNLLAPLGPLLALFFGMIFTLFFINLTPAASGRHLVPFWLHFDGFEQGRGGARDHHIVVFGEVWEGFWRAFGGGWEPLWKAFGVDLVHFKLEISSIDTDVLWN